MRIYTRSGDKGETSLVGGLRVSKDSLRVEAYGSVDELNAFLGLARSQVHDESTQNALKSIQMDLFVVGAELATTLNSGTVGKGIPRITKRDVTRLEGIIDGIEDQLPALRRFILPDGCLGATLLHTSRAVCRRAERRVVTLAKQEDVNPVVIAYLNRLSDLLFVMARLVNKLEGFSETEWKSKM